MRAEYTTTCSICLEDVEPGDQIVRVPGDNEWVHVECAPLQALLW